MRNLKVLVFHVVFVCLFQQFVLACTCTDYGIPLCALFHNADAVFVGTVSSITSAADDKDTNVLLSGANSMSSRGVDLIWVHFNVEKGFKGVSGTEAKVLTYKGTSCDLRVQEGDRWVIFANKDPKTGNLSFGACGGSSGIETNGAEYKELEGLANGSAAFSIRGRVTTNSYDELKGAEVQLNGNGISLKTVTDEKGVYVFDVKKADDYKVKIIVPFSAASMSTGRDERPMDQKPTETETTFEYVATASKEACDYRLLDTFKIDLKATAGISGRFLQNWKFLPKFYPQLCKLMPTEKATLSDCESIYELSPDGKFEVYGLREGHYTIVVNEDDVPDGSAPFLRNYYPGVRDFAKAKAIVLEQGEEKTGLVFKLPPMLPYHEIRGQIFRKDGSLITWTPGKDPRPFISVYEYNAGEEPHYLTMESFLLDWGKGKDGREVRLFDLSPDGSMLTTLFEGYNYIIKVEADPWGSEGECGMMKVDMDSKLKEPLRLILDRKGRCDPKEFAKELESGGKR